jgi:hypothetical protein
LNIERSEIHRKEGIQGWLVKMTYHRESDITYATFDKTYSPAKEFIFENPSKKTTPSLLVEI